MEAYASVPDPTFSLVEGIPLAEEPGIGGLAVTGWLREVTDRFGPREAIVQRSAGRSREARSYAQLWDRSLDVARALIACGLGKSDRVAILATNRAEFIAAFMGTSLAGGIAVPLSTLSTPYELGHLIAASQCSILIAEPEVLGKDFIETIAELDPAIAATGPGGIASMRFPFLRHAIALDIRTSRQGFEPWDVFLRSSASVPAALVERRAEAVSPAIPPPCSSLQEAPGGRKAF